MSFQDNGNRSAINAAVWLGLAAILSLFAWEFRAPIEQLDDAYISYRYAQNLVDGNGLVFNIGERVEGYTNLLWVLLVAIGIKLGFSAPIFGHWLCIGTGMLLLWVSYFYCAILLPRTARPLALLAPLLLLSFNCFVKWTTSGLEQGFFAALVVLALCAAMLGRPWLTTLLCILATLMRPEGVLVAALLLNLHWVKALLRGEMRDLRTVFHPMAPALSFGVFVVLLTLFRWVYYADVVPNTFHAKVGGIPLAAGTRYVELFALDGPGLLIVGACLSAILVPRYRLGFVLVAIFLLYVLKVRGDVFPNGRFLLPVLPVLIAGGIVSIHALYQRHRYVAFGLSLLLPAAAFVSLYVTPGGWSGLYVFEIVTKPEFPYSIKRDQYLAHESRSPEWVAARVAAIKNARPPVHLVASIGIGQLGYYAPDIQILDLLGLIDKTIAKSTRKPPENVFLLPGHQRSDPDYVFSRKPDLINIPKKGSSAILPAVIDLWNDPRLESDYHWDEALYSYRINR